MENKDLSPGEETIKSLERKDRIMRIFEVIVLFTLMVFTLYTLIRINGLANTNIANIIEHREQVESGNTSSQEQIRQVALTNRARLDVIDCIISVSPTVRTPEYVKSCYDLVEKNLGVKIERFGDGR